MPIGASTSSPHKSRPGSSRCPGLRRKNVTVADARGAMPRTAPLAPSTPLGTSTATTGTLGSTASITSRGLPSTGRASPAPNIASIIRPAPLKAAVVSGSTAPSQRSAASAASPRRVCRSPRSATRTGQPRSANSRAATNPSPPLLPGPQRITTGRRDQRRATVSATARPAFSISALPDTPPAIVSRSASPISAGGNSACRRHGSLRFSVGGTTPITRKGGERCGREKDHAAGRGKLDAVASIRYLTSGGGCSSVG